MTATWKPNFLIIGANKGGTTSLSEYLKEHPEVFIPEIKEPMFFNHYANQQEDGQFKTQRVIKSLTSYQELFKNGTGHKARGEASTSYLANPYCAKHIHDFNKDMKLIAILRNPIKRAYSNYLMYVRWGDENRSFYKALKDELAGVEQPQGKQYLYLGHYLNALKTYKDLFGAEQLKVYINEDLRKNPQGVYKEICDYLTVDNTFVPAFDRKYNTNDAVETRPFQKALKKADKKVNFSKLLPYRVKKRIFNKPSMSKKAKRLLIDEYEVEIKELSVFLNRDLTQWLTKYEE